MEMTAETLKRYCSNKQEIKELQVRLNGLFEGDNMIDHDVIIDGSKGYPRPQAIIGIDYERYRRQKKRIENLISKLQSENDNIEEFVFGIEDRTTRRIFTMYYLDGLTQHKIAKRLFLSQASISSKILGFWQKSLIKLITTDKEV